MKYEESNGSVSGKMIVLQIFGLFISKNMNLGNGEKIRVSRTVTVVKKFISRLQLSP
jgi:hypothetical protein